MRYTLLFSLFFISLLSCSRPEARRPVDQKSGSFIEASAERNKKIYEQEKAVIQKMIAADSTTQYFSTEQGFWYYYNVKDTLGLDKKPVVGDKVTFTYNVKDFEGNVILNEAEVGVQNYIVDQSNQELTSGLRDGIKLLKEGETATFVFPSFKAYGYYGIEKKLGTNVPITSTVTLLSINQTQEN